MIFSSYYEKMEVIARITVVYALMVLLFFVDCAAFPSPFQSIMHIPFLTIMVFYWALYRPTLLSAALIFIAGLLFDALTGLPLGISAAVLIVMYYSILSQRSVLLLQPFWIIWAVFAITQAAIVSIQWSSGSLIHLQWHPLYTIAVPLVISVIAFPCLVFIFNLIHKILPDHHLALTSR